MALQRAIDALPLLSIALVAQLVSLWLMGVQSDACCSMAHVRVPRVGQCHCCEASHPRVAPACSSHSFHCDSWMACAPGSRSCSDGFCWLCSCSAGLATCISRPPASNGAALPPGVEQVLLLDPEALGEVQEIIKICQEKGFEKFALRAQFDEGR